MNLGAIFLWGDDLNVFKSQIHLAEELGYGLMTVDDTTFAWHDLYASLGVAAAETSTATLSPMVTTPYMRHPVVAVAAMSALHELSGGRVVFTIGAGGSAASGLGRVGASVEDLRDYLLAMRALSAGEKIVWEGTPVTPMKQARPFPLFLSAYGPKALRLAGEVADGVVLSLGSSLGRVEENIAAVRQSAIDAGRDPDEIDIWGYSFVSVRDTRADALDDIKAFLVTTATSRLRPARAMARVPAEFRDAVLELRARYDVSEHVVVGGANSRLLDEIAPPGFLDFLAGESALCGTPDEVSSYLDGLESLGVSSVIAALPGNADPEGTLRRFAAAETNRSGHH